MQGERGYRTITAMHDIKTPPRHSPSSLIAYRLYSAFPLVVDLHRNLPTARPRTFSNGRRLTQKRGNKKGSAHHFIETSPSGTSTRRHNTPRKGGEGCRSASKAASLLSGNLCRDKTYCSWLLRYGSTQCFWGSSVEDLHTISESKLNF